MAEVVQRPYVKFEFRATEDRTIPSKSGSYPLIDKAWAIVRAPGSKDSLEKLVEEWLVQLSQYAKDDRIPRNWPAEYTDAYEKWKKGEEVPVHGTSLKNWPPLTPAQLRNVLNAGISTVEDLALANDQVLANIGMNAHMLKQMAASWVADNKAPGESARLLQEALVRLEAANNLIKEQSEALARLTVAKKG